MADPGLIRRYLLGAASEQEGIAFENEYIANSEVFETLVAAENDLIDSYCRGDLSSLERQQFESRYLTSSRGRARVEFSRLLTEVSKEARPTKLARRPSFWEKASANFREYTLQWGLVAACAAVLIIAIGSIGILHIRDVSVRSEESAREGQHMPRQNANKPPENTTNEPTSKPTETEIASASPRQVTLRLETTASRSIDTKVSNTVSLPAKSAWLNVELKVDDNGEGSYVAELESPDGSLLERIAGLKSRLVSGQSIVPLRLPSELIPTGDYVIQLKSFAGGIVDSYSFRVLNK